MSNLFRRNTESNLLSSDRFSDHGVTHVREADVGPGQQNTDLQWLEDAAESNPSKAGNDSHDFALAESGPGTEYSGETVPYVFNQPEDVETQLKKDAPGTIKRAEAYYGALQKYAYESLISGSVDKDAAALARALLETVQMDLQTLRERARIRRLQLTIDADATDEDDIADYTVLNSDENTSVIHPSDESVSLDPS